MPPPGAWPRPPAPSSRSASADRTSALFADAASAVDPPAPVGDLRAEIDRFTTLDACVQERAGVDPLVGDALDAIGYDTFLRDACRVLDAAKSADARRCDAIVASTLRSRCQATAAQVNGVPDACPWDVSSQPSRGRDAACLAISARAPRLCAGADDSPSRVTCEAVLAHAPKDCARIAQASDRARCDRAVVRWSGVVPETATVATPVAAGKLHADGATNSGPIDVDLTPDVERGTVLVEQRDGTRFALGRLSSLDMDMTTGAGIAAASPHVRPSLGVSIFVPAGSSAVHAPIARVERAELIAPGHLELATPAARSTLTAKVETLDAVRGGAVKIVVDGDIGDAAGTWRVHGEISTFVRDVVKAGAAGASGAATGRPPMSVAPLGQVGEMR